MSGSVPRVSVVLPTRNRASTLGQAIASVLDQDFDDLELIVVDDASSDGTDEVLGDLQDPRLRVLRRDVAGGAAVARNRAIEVATGELLAFQDSDDRWMPRSLSARIEPFAAGDDTLAVVYGSVRRPREEGGGLIPGPADTVRSGDLAAVLPRYNIVNLPAAVVRAEPFRAVGGFDERLGRYQDWELFLRLSRRWRFEHVDEVVVEQSIGTNRISSDRGAQLAALRMILDEHADLFVGLPAAAAAYRGQVLRGAVAARDAGGAARAVVALARRPSATFSWLANRVRGGEAAIDRDRTIGHS